MSTATAARPQSEQGSHWYYPDSRPCYEVPNASKGGMRKTTLADARKLGLLPSCTTILGVLDKPALTAWKVEQAVLTVLTAPRLATESLDDFIKRVLHDEAQQDQESQIARDRGTAIHDALEKLCMGQAIDPEIDPWVRPAFEATLKLGSYVASEKILVGDGYAGKTDLLLSSPACWWLIDWKSTKKLPKEAYPEARLQLAAYAKCVQEKAFANLPIRTANVYISTVDCGKFIICEHGDWQQAYEEGFKPLVTHFRYMTGHYPKQ